MKSPRSPRKLLRGILSGTCTPLDMREFAQLCYTLALPLIRKKIALGKINLNAIGMKEPDVVYDCLADLFRRDQKGEFYEIRSFFQDQLGELDDCSDEAVVAALRPLIFAKVNQNVIRMYGEMDPTLGKILRNIRLALERTQLFKQVTRFGEVHLIPAHLDELVHLPPMAFEMTRREFSRVVLIHDNIPTMLKKLHSLLVEQDEYQRGVPLVTAALLFREIYSLEWEAQEEAVELAPSELEEQDVVKLVDKVCAEVYAELYPTYVTKGKRSEDLFKKYIRAVKGILLGLPTLEGSDGVSHYDSLRREIPKLTRQAYRSEHRAVLEYLAKIAKQRMREEVKKI
jgi:hypothetical protein